ncbi:AraC family transcriptional regulator [Acinetobacter colistiniresistens]|uniref:AraC family transcriptional regulator n=1 Tax=Acinetobacter colistiniresistens TaxID=280145 RepID=UPI000BDF2805|nr:helix-turn-helix transcriptional regulator [Acinetobacter colistiniresistens]
MKRDVAEQFPFLHGIEVHEFLYQKDDIVTPHSSLWGDFNFSLNGTLEFDIEGKYYLSPPSYGLWLPPRTEHQSLPVEHEIHYICIRLHPKFGDFLGAECRCYSIEPFLRALVLQILEQQKQAAAPEYREHLLQVLLDQLKQAPAYSHYLPQSSHPILAPILERLADPDQFNQSLQQLLQQFPVSERHVLRLSQQELQLSLSEWRNRAKIIFAINQIRQGMTIKQLAFTLGYHHSSSFIEFFKRYTGQTPIQLKNSAV